MLILSKTNYIFNDIFILQNYSLLVDKCTPKCQPYQQCKKYEIKILDTTYRMPIFRCVGDPPSQLIIFYTYMYCF